jgi:protease-4
VKHKGLLITAIFIVVLGFAFMAGAFMYLISGDDEFGTGFFGGRVGVVEVEGPIVTSKEILEDLEQLHRDSSIKAIVLRVESPGGSVAASQEILEKILEVKKDKPVVASMGSVAASGGYYISCGATKIFANPGTITGSIGVRVDHMNVGDLMRWAKMDRDIIKSGDMKDMLRADKPISPEARAVIQGVIDEIFGQFRDLVATSRSIDPGEVSKLADGRIFTGEKALSLKLVDAIGGFSKAVEEAASLGGIEGEPKVSYPKHHRRWLDRVVSEAKSGLLSITELRGFLQPMFLYSTN